MNTATTTVAPLLSNWETTNRVVEALANQDYDRDILRQAILLENEDQKELFALARARRESCFPANEVEVRSVVEISNICVQACHYCGMAKGNTQPKYLVKQEDFVEIVSHLYECGRRVILVQSGENHSQNFVNHVAKCVSNTLARFPDIEFILCLGNLTDAQYRQLKDVGAARYILKFETANPALYHGLKPTDTLEERTACLENLIALGFKVGSGNMVGLPDQTIDDIVDDVVFSGKFPLAMISSTVFIPGHDTKLHAASPGNADWALNTIALLRILYPERLIPATSPFERLKKDGQLLSLMAGANTVTCHDGTPEELKKLFPIYDSQRFTPNADKLKLTVKNAGLALAKGSLI
jgi:biotin synthase